jgi:hypothetical protein
MKKFFLISIALLMLSSCYKDAQTTSSEGNGFKVEFLFEKDGVKVYRFSDGGKAHYFTTMGETMTTQSSGKSNYRENIK